MTKNEFIESLIFHIFKDEPYDDTRYLKTIFKKLLGCEYEDERVNKCYVRITNYQIAKYGRSLFCQDRYKKRR